MPKDTVTTTHQLFSADAGGAIMLPHEAFLHDAVLTREGADLVLTLDSGETVVIEGYFATLDAPDLVSPKGGVLSPELVESFLTPTHAGEYAQNGGTMNDVSAAGQIVQVKGEVYITRADGTKIQAEAGTRVFRGDIVETVGDGAAKIVFADNSSFAISKEARLSIDDYIYDSQSGSGSSFFSMLKGAFLYTSGLIGKKNPDEVNIETPVGSIGIRGTVVAGEINTAGEESEIIIIDGAVVFTNSTGSYDLDGEYETLRLTSYDSQPEYGTVDASYVESNYDFYTAPDNTNDNDGDGTTQQQDGSTGDDGGSAPEQDDNDNGATQDGSLQDGGDSTTAAAESDALLVQQMVNLQMQQEFEDALGDEYLDENGGEVVVTETTDTGGDTAAAGTTGGILDQAGDGTAPTGDFQAVPQPDITVDNIVWTTGGTIREFANISKTVGQIQASSTNGAITSYQIVNGNEGYNTMETFNISNDGTITVASDLASHLVTNYTLTIRIEDSANEWIETTVNINVDSLSAGRVVWLGTAFADEVLDTDILAGTSQLFYGNAGNDEFEVVGTNSGDIFLGGDGSDFFQINSLDFTLIDGGYTGDGGLSSLAGTLLSTDFTGDTVRFLGGGIGVVDLRAATGDDVNKFQGIENFAFTGTDAHGLMLDTAGILQMTDPGGGELRIWGADSNAIIGGYTVQFATGEFTLTTDVSGVAHYQSTVDANVSVYIHYQGSDVNTGTVNVLGV